MKANELMVGDFVKVNRDVCIKNGTIVEIRAIDADNAFIEKGLKGCATCVNINDHCEFGGVWVDFLEPIPLTPEILKANGFEEDPEDGTMCWGNKELEEVTWRGTILKIDSLSASLELVSCMYVHQLQHALKLCGINKEIVL